MKNSAKKSNIIFSRVKESFEGILSIFNEVAELDNEISLPDELRDSLEHLDKEAKNFEINGITSSKSSEHTQVNIPKENTKTTKLLHTSVNKNNNNKDIELDER